jgi:hypothetical protein
MATPWRYACSENTLFLLFPFCRMRYIYLLIC